jgi:trimeric autotransporter adhesin
MAWRTGNHARFVCALAVLLIANTATASRHRGQVTFDGLPVPGAQITASQGGKKVAAITDGQGMYSFDLTDGTWTIEVEMQCFSRIQQDIAVAPDAPPSTWVLKLLPIDEIRAAIEPQRSGVQASSPPAMDDPSAGHAAVSPSEPEPPAEDDLSQRASDGLLISGSVNNGAASPFAQMAAFGNRRNGAKGLYNGGIGVILDSSALDARPFSLSGLNLPKAAYNRVTGVATLGGRLRIPHVLAHGPFFFVGYQWTRSRNDATQAGLVPDAAERAGDFSNQLNPLGQPIEIFNPATGMQFPGNAIPAGLISPQAQALLNFYPLPNVPGNALYNFQVPIVSDTHQDALQSRFNRTINSKNESYGDFAFLSTRSDTPNLFGFLDTTSVLGINSGIYWSHRFGHQLFEKLGYRFSRLATRITPYWENRLNISSAAGITGNDQDPMDWGPPSLNFASGVAGLRDANGSHNRDQTSAVSYSLLRSRSRHNLTFGFDFRRQQFNYLSQQNPRGTFTFTGVATQGVGNGGIVGGSDVADFLLGIPDTSAIAFGNADKYFRESVYDAYAVDDFRITPEFSVNAGVRWEYGAPITELHDRLVNLDIAPGFSAVAPVVATDPVGSLTGQSYPRSLLWPDKRLVEPRMGLAWRPMSSASTVIRGGYGIYSDTSVYQTIAVQMAQQAPLSKSLSVQNSPACPLTLANGFNVCPSITPDSFAVDPHFRVGYAQSWTLTLQRDLPASLLLSATYLGVKGTRGVQEFLPNTSPIGAVNPCPGCPTGFAFLTANGNSTRQGGQVQLRRRLHNGLTGTIQYTFSKSIDDDSLLGGQGPYAAAQNAPSAQPPAAGLSSGASPSASQTPTIAQNWLNLRAERGLSTFDQRHLLNLQLQYTTGMGLGGQTLLSGWKGTLFKEWTWLAELTVGSGLPETPLYLAAVPGTGVTGTIRPDVTGAPIYTASSGRFLNPAAYSAPRLSQWGDAGRDSIIGPRQFTLNASLGRIFRLHDRLNLDFRLDATNLLNQVTFASWISTTNSAQFGLPTAANAMRSVQATLRLRF